jgi:hypothetical protein
MRLTEGEYCQFGLRARVRLLHQFGVKVCELPLKNMHLEVFRLYDFFVEVCFEAPAKTPIRAEPVMSIALVEFYEELSLARHPPAGV